MKKVLFLIHDLGYGGAEKVLVNLVNNMDSTKFDITVMSLFGGGENEQFLSDRIKYVTCFDRSFPANSHLMKCFSPSFLHKRLIKEKYDIEVAYLEGPASRIISGCPYKETKLVSWIHIEQKSKRNAARAFRSFHESNQCYKKFDQIVCVSKTVREDFMSLYPDENQVTVLYNTNETQRIRMKATETCADVEFRTGEFKLVGVGKIVANKGFDRLARIHKRLIDEGIPVHTYILGVGKQKAAIEKYLKEHMLTDSFTFVGYQANPYKYVSKCDLFVCSSYAEGFSTAATEALIVGTPVCTVEVSGMKEMLGENNEYGLVVENNDEALYEGIKRMLTEPGLLEYYKHQAKIRGREFSTEKTVEAVGDMLCEIGENML